MSEWATDPPGVGETPLLPAEWEQLCRSTTERAIDKERLHGAGIELVEVRLDSAFPTTSLVVRMRRDDRVGERRWELYRPRFLAAPMGRLPSASAVAWNVSLYCVESVGRIYARTPAAQVRDCFEICAPTIDTVPGVARRVERLYWDDNQQIVVAIRSDQEVRTVAVECFEEGIERPLWVVAEDFRERLVTLAHSLRPA